MKISNVIHCLLGDIYHSDCGRDLNNIVGKCARICVAEHSAIISKIKLVAAVIGAGVALVSPFALGILGVKIALARSPHVLVTISAVCVVAYAVWKMIKYELIWCLEFSTEYHAQKQEKEVVGVLGGKAAYEALPRLSSVEKVFDDIYQHGMGGSPGFTPDPAGPKPNVRLIPVWPEYSVEDYDKLLEGLAPNHVGFHPITVDVDFLNRPFISVCVKEKNKQNKADAFVATLFFQHVVKNCWGRAGHAGNVFKDYHGPKGPEGGRKAEAIFTENTDILRQLQDGTHPTHELV